METDFETLKIKNQVNNYWNSLTHEKQEYLIKKYCIRIKYFISFEAKEYIYKMENN